MNGSEPEKSFGELPTWGRGEPRKAEPRNAADGPSWSALGLSEAETLRPPEGIRDDGRTDAARRWKPGEAILDRYVVERELGQGGMGVVYGCLDKVGGVRVAVKCLPPELSHNSVEMEEVRENFELVYRLNHPNIAAVKTLERDARGEYFLVMELVEGESLRAWLRHKWKAGGVSLDEAVGVLQQVAVALDYAHSEKIVHRDVKPGNVMVDGRGRVKVLDFGLAAQIRTSLSRASHAYRGTSGTGPYMAPEQWLGKQQDGTADQYALGVMAYEMLAGHLPFENSELAVLKDAVLHGSADPVPGLPKGAMAALWRAMAKRKEERFGSCGEFVEALAGERGTGGGRGSGRGKTLMGWVAALAVLGGVGWGAWWWGESGRGMGGLEGAGKGNAVEEMARPEGSPQQGIAEETEAKLKPATGREGSHAGDRMTVRVGAREVALRWCPADTFTMGSQGGEQGRDTDEMQHQVKLTRGFWMGETEVTQGLWREVMKDAPSYFKSGDNYPVKSVSWEDCQKFVQAFNSRYPQEGLRWALPTEAQWEYACRAGTGTAYSWGNALNGDKANCNGKYPCGTTVKGPYKKETTPVGSYEPNAWGLYDMHGNVWEWCADWYGPYPSGLVTDPPGPSQGPHRVHRGGSWASGARDCRAANRPCIVPDYRFHYLGLRVALLPV